VDIRLKTDVPLSTSLGVGVELPHRVRASLGVGLMPGPYLDIIQGMAVGFGWYDQVTADLIDAALQGSLLIHPEVGWRPLPKAGFHFDGGYSVAALGGAVTGSEALEALTGTELKDRDGQDAVVELTAGATDHMLTVRLGWEFVIAKRLVIDPSLGGAFTVGAGANIETDLGSSRFGGAVDNLSSFSSAGEAELVKLLKQYVHTPFVGVSVAYRFGQAKTPAE
jgi:hypothetical protein